MELQVFATVDELARQAAALIAGEARAVLAARGRFTLAVSGGRTPWLMLRALTEQDVSWQNVHVAQVDERVAPTGHADRNLTHLQTCLLENARLDPERLYGMPVDEPDLEAAAQNYARSLEAIAGVPPVFDLIHLGLGADGHTASLVPGDPVLDVTDADVAVTSPYAGKPRMTLTYPILNRARRILWVVTGREKMSALARLLAGDASIPAGRVSRERALLFADQAALSEATR